MRKKEMWNKDFLSLWICNLLLFCTFYALITTLPLYTTEMLKGDKQQSGLVMLTFLISAVIFRIFSGRWLDTIGRKSILLISLSLFMISSVLYLFVDNITALVALRIIHGASFGIGSTATGTIAADLLPENRKGEGIGYYALSYNMAMFIGPFLSLSILSHYNFTIMFSVLICFSLLSIILALTIYLPKIAAAKQNKNEKKFHWKLFLEPNAIPVSLTALFLSFAFSGFLTYIPLYAKELGMEQHATYFYIIYALAMIFSRPFIGRLADRYNENVVIYPTISLYIIGLIMLSQANEPFMFLATAAIIGLGFGSISPVLQAIAIKSTSSDKRGIATGTYLSFFDTGVGLGSFFLAILAEAAGFRAMYANSTFLVLLAVMVYYLFHHRQKKSKDKALQA